MLNGVKVRHQGNGKKSTFPDDEEDQRTGRKSCEFCYHTAGKCHLLCSETDAACKTCSYVGMKCMDRGGRKMPDGNGRKCPAAVL